MANEFKILLAISLIGLGGLPAQAASSSTVTDYLAEQPAINQTRFILLFDAPIENLEKDDFVYTAGCTIGYLEIQGATAQVDMIDCPTGLVTLTLKANSMGSGALGPQSDLKFQLEIDATEPTATFSEIQIEGPGPFTYTTLLRFSELVEFDAERLRFSSNVSCNTSIVEISGGLRLRASCGHADLSWTLPAGSLTDRAGHPGPYRDVRVSVANPAPAPIPAPAPPVPIPVTPAPIPAPPPTLIAPPVITPPPVLLPINSDPTASSTVSESAEQVAWEPSTLPIEPPMFVQISTASIGVPLLASGNESNLLAAVQGEQPQALTQEPPFLPQVVTDSAEPKATVKPALTAAVASELERQDNSFGFWLIGVGSAILIALGLVRRFSGR